MNISERHRTITISPITATTVIFPDSFSTILFSVYLSNLHLLTTDIFHFPRGTPSGGFRRPHSPYMKMLRENLSPPAYPNTMMSVLGFRSLRVLLLFLLLHAALVTTTRAPPQPPAAPHSTLQALQPAATRALQSPALQSPLLESLVVKLRAVRQELDSAQAAATSYETALDSVRETFTEPLLEKAGLSEAAKQCAVDGIASVKSYLAYGKELLPFSSAAALAETAMDTARSRLLAAAASFPALTSAATSFKTKLIAARGKMSNVKSTLTKFGADLGLGERMIGSFDAVLGFLGVLRNIDAVVLELVRGMDAVRDAVGSAAGDAVGAQLGQLVQVGIFQLAVTCRHTSYAGKKRSFRLDVGKILAYKV